MSLALAAAGARVAMMDLDAQSLAVSVSDVRNACGSDAAVSVHGDISVYADAEKAVQTAISALGGLHILVNNAGINPRFERFWEVTPDVWARTLGVNLNGSFNMARASVDHLRAQAWGRIIGITTSLDTMLRPTPYGPSKAGHEALIAAMARDLEGSGVTANVLMPGGAANTNMVPRERHGPDLVDPEAMGGPVVWLASPASDGFTGRRIVARDWDEGLPIEERLARASAPAGWPQLGRARGASLGL